MRENGPFYGMSESFEPVTFAVCALASSMNWLHGWSFKSTPCPAGVAHACSLLAISPTGK
jgi:hypothetical protein